MDEPEFCPCCNHAMLTYLFGGEPHHIYVRLDYIKELRTEMRAAVLQRKTDLGDGWGTIAQNVHEVVNANRRRITIPGYPTGSIFPEQLTGRDLSNFAEEELHTRTEKLRVLFAYLKLVRQDLA